MFLLRIGYLRDLRREEDFRPLFTRADAEARDEDDRLGDFPRALRSVSPMSAGLSTTWIPAFIMAAIFSAAVPFPPEMIAPACPMRRPGGAVLPAMKPTTGFLNDFLTYSAASSSAVPPISPIMMTASVLSSSLKSFSASTNLVPT